MSLKAQKEAFVTGHNGTTIYEILLVCTSSPIGILLFHELRHFFLRMSKNNNHLRFFSTEEELPFGMLILIETITILLPMALCETKLFSPYGVIVLSVELLIGLSLRVYRKYINEMNQYSNHKLSPSSLSSSGAPTTSASSSSSTKNKVEYLTFYRSTVSFLTFVAILAVDFPIFPRSFAKTEVYGYGLMDVGAGSFVVIGGLVSSFARKQNKSTKNHDYNKKKMKKTVINMFPLLLMGFIRFITTKGLEYQEHVSEYGVHWNFFFTLVFVNIGGTLVRCISDLRVPLISWIPLLIIYQMLLSLKNGQTYIVDAPRHCVDMDFYFCNFFAANREGICGCVGYLIIYLACEDIGKYCIWSCRTHHSTKQGKRIFICASLFWILHWISSSALLFGITVSRRSTNATFILWTIAHNLTILLLIWLSFYFCSDNSDTDPSGKSKFDQVINPPIFDAVNRHGLIVFILANLMTGAVNLSMNTLEASSGKAIVVIFCYLCSVGGVALLTSHILDTRPNRKNL